MNVMTRKRKGNICSMVTIFMMVVAIFGSLFITFNETVKADALTTDFSHYKPITINSSQVSGNLTNFPVLINITDTDLRDGVTNDSGWDIAFFNETDVQLNHEIELWDNTTGQLVAWVNVTNVLCDEDTTIYIYYGDDDIASTCENVPETWDSNFIAVYHFNDASDNITDSTYKENTTVVVGAPTYEQTGIAGYCVQGDGDDGWALDEDFDNSGENISGSANFTLETWYYTTSDSAYQRHYVFYNNTGIWTGLRGDQDDDIRFTHDTTGSANWDTLDANGAYTTNTWTYVVNVFNGIETLKSIYVNSVFNISNANTANIGDREEGDDGNSILVYYRDGDEGFVGYADEMRVSSIPRSTDYINATYNTIINGTDGGFFSLGAESGSQMVVETPSPANTATGVSINLAQTSITIEQLSGETFNWTIQGAFLTNSNANGATNGSKTATVTAPLSYSTEYTWYVNATDGATWDNKTYTFTTLAEPGSEAVTIEKSANVSTVASGTESVKINYTIWVNNTGSQNFTWVLVNDTKFNCSCHDFYETGGADYDTNATEENGYTVTHDVCFRTFNYTNTLNASESLVFWYSIVLHNCSDVTYGTATNTAVVTVGNSTVTDTDSWSITWGDIPIEIELHEVITPFIWTIIILTVLFGFLGVVLKSLRGM